jgi:predicted transcriptional regulator
MTLPNDQSVMDGGAVVYSFKAKWDRLIRKGDINLFFRKNAPSTVPRRVYFYVGAPIKQIVGWAEITDIALVAKEEAFGLAGAGAIDVDELRTYLANRSSVSVIRTRKITLLTNPVTLHEVQQKLVFHPPQSFCQLTEDDENVIQELGR